MMKNHIFLIILLLLTVGTISCSDNSYYNTCPESNRVTDRSFSDLNNSLDSLTTVYMKSHTECNSSRKNFFSSLWKVVCADVSTCIIKFLESFDCNDALSAGSASSTSKALQEIFSSPSSPDNPHADILTHRELIDSLESMYQNELSLIDQKKLAQKT